MSIHPTPHIPPLSTNNHTFPYKRKEELFVYGALSLSLFNSPRTQTLLGTISYLSEETFHNTLSNPFRDTLWPWLRTRFVWGNLLEYSPWPFHRHTLTWLVRLAQGLLLSEETIQSTLFDPFKDTFWLGRRDVPWWHFFFFITLTHLLSRTSSRWLMMYLASTKSHSINKFIIGKSTGPYLNPLQLVPFEGN